MATCLVPCIRGAVIQYVDVCDDCAIQLSEVMIPLITSVVEAMNRSLRAGGAPVSVLCPIHPATVLLEAGVDFYEWDVDCVWRQDGEESWRLYWEDWAEHS
jgi:hypothetical protein